MIELYNESSARSSFNNQSILKIKLLESIMFHYIMHCKNDRWIDDQSKYNKHRLQFEDILRTVYHYYPDEYDNFFRVSPIREAIIKHMESNKKNTLIYKSSTPIFYFLEMYLEIVFGFTFVLLADRIGWDLVTHQFSYNKNNLIFSFCRIERNINSNDPNYENDKYLNKYFFSSTSSGNNANNFCLNSEKILTKVDIGIIDHMFIKQYDLDEQMVSLILIYDIAQCFGEFTNEPESKMADVCDYSKESTMRHKYAEKFCINSGYTKEDIKNMNNLINIMKNDFTVKDYENYYNN